MTVKQLSAMIGRDAQYMAGRGGEMLVDVRIVDARVVYGSPQALIVPVRGTGATWVALESLRDRDRQ